MGMAASQARFLGLTARKTNVEYEGQQVNQQRTALANESSGLFNRMMGLEVPIPPSTNDFYQMRYTANNSELVIMDMRQTSGAPGTHEIRVRYPEKSTLASWDFIKANTNATAGASGSGEYQIDWGTDNVYNSVYANDKDLEDLKAIDAVRVAGQKILLPDGSIDPSNPVLKFTNAKSGQVFYVLENDLKIENGKVQSDATRYQCHEKEMLRETYVNAVFRQGQYDDFSSFHVDSDDLEARYADGRLSESAYNMLKDYANGVEYPLDLKQINDNIGFEEAMRQYEVNKMKYEKEIQDINAKTEILQQQDRTLELRLKQLDTEQKALTTEMDAVSAVIKKNVETTFKTFA
ncbi:hypothetical protein tpqmel_0655 [Candidatus Gastranaerophilus sp. (ex Termes propinquus)]|nr:hypothetical protein tpqmel_0655 [Candidatus Gastranaerophilus sp. (ex Termes propinquus)]